MKGIKKFLVLIIALLAILCFTGCGGVYKPPAGTGGSPSGGGGTVTEPEKPGVEKPDPEEEYFTVKMYCNGAPFVPYPAKVTAKWANETNVYSADFDASGVAKMANLNGDYQVTISGLPDGYTYDPNIYTATNNKKDVEIIVFRLSSYTGTGANKYDSIITLNYTGIYRATLTREGQTIFFQYHPTKNGIYTFSSILDITADEVNPLLDVYHGSFAWKPATPNETVDGGGPSGLYTKNFVWSCRHADENTGSVYAFGIRATGIKASAFPITVDFILERDGEFTNPVLEFESIAAKEINGKYADRPAGTWRSISKLSSDGILLDGKFARYNAQDGYYHVYDPESGVEGGLLYAKITVPTLEPDAGDEAGTGNNAFTNELVSLRLTVRDPENKRDENGNIIYHYKNYTNFIRGTNGYASYVNSDGVYPVTQELKEFLQEFASCNSYFKDGDGVAERYLRPDGTYVKIYDSSETNMWLFAVGYYA